jgi:hypothetical protein
MSTILAPLFLARSITLLGEGELVFPEAELVFPFFAIVRL